MAEQRELRKSDSFYYFDDKNREIVFKRHDMPTPWMNYLTNGTFFTMISQAGGNLSWYKAPGIWRIGRYNFYLLPVDVNGMFVYIKDKKTGKVWNPSFIPCNEKLDSWESAHGLGYTRFYAEKDGVRAKLKCFVGKTNALCYNLEITSEDDRDITVFVCQEMGMMEYIREVQWQCYCKNSMNILYDKEADALVYEYFPDMQRRPDETPFVFFTADRKCTSYCGDRFDFIGAYRGLDNPLGVELGKCSNKELRGGEAMFSMSFDIFLKANKTETLNVYLGTFGQEDNAVNATKELKKKGFADELFSGVKDFWEDRLSHFQVNIPDDDSARMMNTWNALQVFVNFEVSRNLSYYATGTVRGMGVRDTMQDCFSNMVYDLEGSKEKIKLVIAQQFKCGKTTHSFYPEERFPSEISDRSDDHLWMVYGAYRVVMEEGKTDFLFETVPYFDGGEGTILEHILKAIEWSNNNLGKDGITLMMNSDWNDVLNTVCREGKGESVFASEQLVLACSNAIELLKLLGKDYSLYEKIKEQQIKAINENCWDGEWFIRAVMDDGFRIGMKGQPHGEIWINSQTWAVLSGATTKERQELCMDKVFEKLDCGYGLIKLDPPLTRNYPSKENEITFAQPGVGENAGVFCHANTWAIIAECMLGHHERAYKLYRDLIPHNVAQKVGVDTYVAEPYVYSSNIKGPAALKKGQAGHSWLTGTSSWMMLEAMEYIFGLKPSFNGLKIEPCIPNAWKQAFATRKFRGTTYNITFKNPSENGSSVKKILLDGKEIDGNTVFSNNLTAEVTVLLG